MTLRDDHADAEDEPAAGPAPGLGDGAAALPPVAPLCAPVSAVVVDPQAAVREGLPLLLRAQGVDIVATAATAAEGEGVISRLQPAVALIAFDLPDVEGIVLLRRLVERGLRTAFVLYGEETDPQQAAAAVDSGAAGVVAKRSAIAELAAALRAVAAGGLWFGEPAPAPARPPSAAEQLAELRSRRTATLSGSELRVLTLVAHGHATDAIAEQLSLSPHTVRTHLRNVMRKLHATSRAHAVAIAMREAAIEA